MKMQESPEDYLEAILMIKLQKGKVRSIDVARHLGFSKPSVSVAMKRLRENGYVLMDEDGYLTLTDSGNEIASSIYERHTIVSEYLMQLGISEETAINDACRIEHVLSEESFQRIKELTEASRGKSGSGES
ncbi:MAG: metal-dependent transcriptional regulator [Lachnospiraceae bacterium]|nr:metal-dependent transcriptional regulator [Lachnospiraceae bacterium]